MMQNRAVQAS